MRLHTKFQPKLSISFFFWTKVNEKRVLPNKNEKVSTTNEFCIFKLVLAPNFTLNSFEFYDQMFPKMVFLVQNWKSSHHIWILHIRLRLGSKFQLELTILIFWTKFAQNWYSKKLHVCISPWSLLIILNVFARWPTNKTTFQYLFPFYKQRIRNAVNIYFSKNLALT